MLKKSNYICSLPFRNLELKETEKYLCCKAWLLTYLPDNTSIDEAWNSDIANDIRDSILDGSYKHCDEKICPYLQLKDRGNVNIGPLYHKDHLPEDLEKVIDDYKSGKEIKPVITQWSFDKTCNLSCPSCRTELIVSKREDIERSRNIINDIKTNYGDVIKSLYITGTGDPFVSVAFREFLQTFDPTEWPSLKNIHLHTNATRWTKEMWDSMPKIHKYVRTVEISIDAATKDTYENKVRLGGKWDVLLENLKFISTIPTLKRVKTSFVVQQMNYKEMKDFYNLMYSIFGSKLIVYYGKILMWDTYSETEFSEHTVWKSLHPEYEDFIKEVKSFLPKKQCFTNFEDLIPIHKSVI